MQVHIPSDIETVWELNDRITTRGERLAIANQELKWRSGWPEMQQLSAIAMIPKSTTTTSRAEVR
jgi:hypothetical protein